jgi:4-hydroxybenzoate polyprenyltransferase
MAMAFNRLVDRRIDADNPRTAIRHLPAGILGVPTVAGFCIACAAGFVVSTLLFWPNPWPLYVVAAGAGFSVRLFVRQAIHVPVPLLAGGGIEPFPIAAWIAIRGEVAWPPVLLAGGFFWVGGFDIIYACQDVGFDRERGLFSIPPVSAWKNR